MERIRSALYLDVDNIFGGLIQLDRDAAYAMVERPVEWLDALVTWKLPAGDRRDILVKRAYLNPTGEVPDREISIPLSKFRPYLTRAGFEVVDCPTLTARQKNAADIRIVIDILQSLESSTRYDEFIVASSDADFTPVLRLLRTHDRSTVIMSTAQTAEAYRNVAEILIAADDIVTLIKPEIPLENGRDLSTAASDSATMPVEEEQDNRRNVECFIHDYVNQSDAPVFLSLLGLKLRSAGLGSVIDRSQWFGMGSLGALIKSMASTTDLCTKGHLVWSLVKHSECQDLPDFMERCCSITDLPRLKSASWKAVFETLSSYDHEFSLTQCTAWTRDQLKGNGIQVGRVAIGYVVRGALFGGVKLGAPLAPSADEIRDSLIKSTISRAEAQGLNLTEDDKGYLLDWLQGNGGSC